MMDTETWFYVVFMICCLGLGLLFVNIAIDVGERDTLLSTLTCNNSVEVLEQCYDLPIKAQFCEERVISFRQANNCGVTG